MEAIDDDFFSDDGFDDLPADALQQLEHEAFRATQAGPSTQAAPEARVNWAPQDAVNPYPQIETSNPASSTLQPPAHLHTGLTNDYGALDVGELDAEVFDDGVALDDTVAFSERASHNGHDTIVIDDDKPMQADGGQSYYSALHKDHEVLTTQLQQENERYARMESELATAKSLAETKTGEIAIIRSNQSKMIADYERQIAGLRKAMAEEAARYKQEVETARKEGKMLATENVFLKQDLAEESLRSNQARAKLRVEREAPMTPKKTKSLPFRDGFNDEEILAVSPSKSGRSKQATPTVTGKKRRRTSHGSPTPLHLSPHVPQPEVEDAGDAMDDAMLDAVLEVPVNKESAQKSNGQDLHLVKEILNHRTIPDKTDIELMGEMACPSEPKQSLASILLQETAKLDLGNYAIEHMQAVISIWSRALEEKYYQPIPLFLEITRYILAIDTASVMQLLDDLVPVLLASGEVNGIPRFKNSPYARQNFGKVRLTPPSQLEPLVDSTETITVLYQIAWRSLDNDAQLERLWRRIDYSFVLMMLSCSQPIRDIKLTLSLLMTSVRAESFATIHESHQDQISNENWVVDRVASLLWETPQPDEGQPRYTRAEICDMRLEALSFLITVAFNPIVPASTHGSLLIASHPTTLAKLIRAMHDELDALYSFPPERDMHSSMVNGLMRVVYSVIRRHPKEAELQPKLQNLAGGKQQFLVVMTRLAFSEGLVLEAGIEDETVEMAHEILDDAVNPEEAEALLDAFPHAKGEPEVKASVGKDMEMKDTENGE
ncbi:hypothetical protein BDV19DRAFT_361524 [Aspergillus venezuelensis]